MTVELSADQARRLVLSAQGLADEPRRRLPPSGLVDLVQRLGFVQVDSINTLARAHDLILFSRNQTYRPAKLRRAVERDGDLFENWTHDAAIIPTRFYPYWHHRFRREEVRLVERWRDRQGLEFERELDRVLSHIAAEGAIMSRDLKRAGQGESGGWWAWHPSKTALEYLWRTGRLAVARRDGFQKVYDLTERVIPEKVRRVEPPEHEVIDWSCRAALDRLGYGTPGEIAGFWGLITQQEAKSWCERHLGKGVVQAQIGTINGQAPQRVFAAADLRERAERADEAPNRIRVLSPFDPVLRDRKRLARLFGFDYRIEIFVPAARRKYGYYVFPLLEGDRLVGRIDMKADRERDRVDVKALWMEPGVRLTATRQAKLEAELDRIRRFADLATVHWHHGYVKDTV